MLLQKNIIKKYLGLLSDGQVQRAWEQYQAYFLNEEIQANIHKIKEEQFQEGFLRELFVRVLGYTINPSPNYNLTTELKNEIGSKKADGAILTDDKVIGVIELKDHKTPDLSSIENQAFGYKNKHTDTRLVVISNFEKLRLYIDNAVEYREWDIFRMTPDEFRELYLCLAWPQVERGVALQMKQESVSTEDQITNALYRDYSQFKRALFADIIAQNPLPLSHTDGTDNAEAQKEWQLLLFKKTQKLLDRLLFIFFAEDCRLLPPNSIIKVIEQWQRLKDDDEYQPFYNRLKKYFGYMNTGFKGKHYEVFAYNGGLFKPDEVLDSIRISDDLLVEHTRRLSEYDFESDVDVNILGHIFENSLSEIEEVTQSIARGLAPLSDAQMTMGQVTMGQMTMGQMTMGQAPLLSKRKQDGVFYTPQYITKYIVEQTVGRLCAEKKRELGIVEDEYFSDQRRQMQTRKRLLDQLTTYRDWLLQITILDPACGSGAFLNAALQWLMTEHKLIDEMEAKITGSAIEFQGVENSILEHNLFGVDINEESVGIAQLALWLRTAKPHRKLNSLNQNIKCGNSLISPPTIARGLAPLSAPLSSPTFSKAFDWQREFPQVFRKKEKHAYHIVTATHDSRTSQRMIEKHVRELRYHGTKPEADPIILTAEEELLVCQTIDDMVKAYSLNIMAFNICRDHFHMLLVCEEEEVAKIVGMIKSKTAIAVNKHRGSTNTSDKSRSVWTQKYGCNEITTKEQFQQTIQYIANNRIKHELPPLSVKMAIVDYETAFRDEYAGGFDVVIGNPPYVRADSPGNSLEFRNYMTSCGQWETLAGKWDLYIPFLELAIKLSKPTGLCAFIIPDAYCHAEYGKRSLEYMKSRRYLSMIDYFPNIEVFEGVGVKSIIVNFDKKGAAGFVQRIHGADHHFTEKLLDDYPASLRIDAKQSILEGKSHLIPLGNVCYITKGIVGNSDEKQFKGEFEVGDLLSASQDETHPKLYFEGKDIGRWGLMRRRYIEYGTERSPQKWSRKGFTEMFEGSPKLVTMRSPGTQPRTMLDTDNGYFNESAIGFKRWIDLKGVNNSSVSKAYGTEEERRMFEQLSEEYSYSALLAIFNSSLIRYELNTNRRSNIHIYPDDWKRLYLPLSDKAPNNSKGACPLVTKWQETSDKIPNNSKGACPLVTKWQEASDKGGYKGASDKGASDKAGDKGASPLAEVGKLADTMVTLNRQLQEKRSRFLRRLSDNFDGVKVTTALQSFDLLEFKGFLAEMKKQKIRLSPKEQDEWEDYFNDYAAACHHLTTQIAQTDNEIDSRVFDLYGLTYDEVQIVDPETPITREEYEQ